MSRILCELDCVLIDLHLAIEIRTISSVSDNFFLMISCGAV